MTPSVTPFPDLPSQQLWFKYLPDEEFSTICEMSNDLRGLFISMRLYAITHNGFSADMDELWAKAKNFCGISRYKFRKLFPELVKFFTEIDGRFYFSRDEERMEESREALRNSVINGRKGAAARWKERRIQAPQAINQPIAPLSETRMAPDRPEENIQEEIPPPPTNNETTKQGGGGSPPSESTTEVIETLSDTEYQSFCAHCANPPQPLGVPSRALAFRLKQKFKPLPLHHLPKQPGQESPGLWASNTVKPQQMFMEAERQRVVRENPQLFRKPTERELANEEVMRRARERDKAAGRV